MHQAPRVWPGAGLSRLGDLLFSDRSFRAMQRGAAAFRAAQAWAVGSSDRSFGAVRRGAAAFRAVQACAVMSCMVQ